MQPLLGRSPRRLLRRRPGHPPRDPHPVAHWDPGLQNERTALSWRRTIVSAYGASLLVGRMLLDRAPVVAIVLAACSTVLVTAVGARAARRYRTADARLRRMDFLPDAKLSLAAAALVFLVAVMALATILLPS